MKHLLLRGSAAAALSVAFSVASPAFAQDQTDEAESGS